jgi:hypothetical protein
MRVSRNMTTTQTELFPPAHVPTADQRITRTIDRIVTDYGGDLSAYVKALRHFNPAPKSECCERGFTIFSERRAEVRRR